MYIMTFSWAAKGMHRHQSQERDNTKSSVNFLHLYKHFYLSLSLHTCLKMFATMQMKIYFIHTKTRNQFYLFIFPFYTIKLGDIHVFCLCTKKKKRENYPHIGKKINIFFRSWKWSWTVGFFFFLLEQFKWKKSDAYTLYGLPGNISISMRVFMFPLEIIPFFH